MRNRNKEEYGLLEQLQAAVGCGYLSDLHEGDNEIAVWQALLELDLQAYSLQAVNDALQYITSTQTRFDSVPCAAAFAQAQLRALTGAQTPAEEQK